MPYYYYYYYYYYNNNYYYYYYYNYYYYIISFLKNRPIMGSTQLMLHEKTVIDWKALIFLFVIVAHNLHMIQI